MSNVLMTVNYFQSQSPAECCATVSTDQCQRRKRPFCESIGNKRVLVSVASNYM